MIKYYLLVTMVASLAVGCDNNKGKEVAVTGPRKQLPEEGWSIESYMSEGGRVKGKLTAPYMVRYQKADSPYAEFPKSLHVDFFRDSLSPTAINKDSIVIESKMDARYGKYYQNQSKVFLRDSVVVKNILKGDTVYCKELWWDQNTQKFYTDKPVQIYRKDQILFGNGMDADQNFRWFTIHELKGSLLTSQGAMPGK